jgi:release factor glutamine methyltransferase
MATPTPGPVGARTVLDIVRLSTAYLNDHGSESARLDAELLVAHALGIARLDVYLQYDRPLDDRAGRDPRAAAPAGEG